MLRNIKDRISRKPILASHESWIFFFCNTSKINVFEWKSFSTYRQGYTGPWRECTLYAYFSLSALILVIAQQEVHGASFYIAQAPRLYFIDYITMDFLLLIKAKMLKNRFFSCFKTHNFHPAYTFKDANTAELSMNKVMTSCSPQLSMELIVFINVKMPTIVGILMLISMIYTTSGGMKARKVFFFQHFSFMSKWIVMLSWVEHENSFITSGPRDKITSNDWLLADKQPTIALYF